MSNLSSKFGLVDAKIRASDKDLPVLEQKVFHLMHKKPERKLIAFLFLAGV